MLRFLFLVQWLGCFVVKEAAELICRFPKNGPKNGVEMGPRSEAVYPPLSTSACIYMYLSSLILFSQVKMKCFGLGRTMNALGSGVAPQDMVDGLLHFGGSFIIPFSAAPPPLPPSFLYLRIIWKDCSN